MMTMRTTVAFTLGALVAAVSVSERADAQASNYPSMQVPTASTRCSQYGGRYSTSPGLSVASHGAARAVAFMPVGPLSGSCDCRSRG